MKNNFLYLMLIVSLEIMSASAFAAQDTTVVRDNTPIYSEPKTNSKAIEYLPMGVEIRVSSYPMSGGFYKTRAKNGVYGWIHENDISVFKPDLENAKKKSKEELLPRPERDRKWFLRIVGGFDFFAPGDLNSLFEFSDLNTGNHFGGEAGVFLTERIALAFRTEAIFKDLVAREKNSQYNYNLGLRAYPVMGGLDFFILKLPAMRLSVGIFGGVAMATSFASEALNLSTPNVVVLQRNPFTSFARVNLTRPLGRIVSVSLEVGYRHLITEGIDTSAAAQINGGQEVYLRYGEYRLRTIDLSGLVLGAGIGIHF